MGHSYKKLFTPEEANKTLPLVRRIVEDILNFSHEMHALAAIVEKDAAEHPQIRGINEQIQSCFDELEDLGCYYKDWGFSIGLVDFPAMIDETIVFLCWRSDEDSITWYHEIEAGYAGRKKIPEMYLKAAY